MRRKCMSVLLLNQDISFRFDNWSCLHKAYGLCGCLGYRNMASVMLLTSVVEGFMQSCWLINQLVLSSKFVALGTSEELCLNTHKAFSRSIFNFWINTECLYVFSKCSSFMAEGSRKYICIDFNGWKPSSCDFCPQTVQYGVYATVST